MSFKMHFLFKSVKQRAAIGAISLCSIFCFLTGCSVVMASKQDDYVNVEDVQPGVHKRVVISTFGAPVQSYTNSKGEKCEIFKFRQGYKKGTKVGRAVLHGTADVLTLGLWELVGSPVEAGLSGDDVSYEVCYNNEDIVTTTIPLSKYDGKGPKKATTKEEEPAEGVSIN